MNSQYKNSLTMLRIFVVISLVITSIVFAGAGVFTKADSKKQNALPAWAKGNTKAVDMPMTTLRIQRVKDKLIVPLPKSALILVWSKDCPPCLKELQRFAKYSEAAKPLKLMSLSLDDRESTQNYLRRLKISEENALFTDTAPTIVLEQLGSRPPLLPFALSLDANGQRCSQHTGLLGMAKIKQWAKAC